MKKTMTTIKSFLMIFTLLAVAAAGQEKTEDLFSTQNGSLPAAIELRDGDIDIVTLNDALLRSGDASGAELSLRFMDGAYEFQAIRTSLKQNATGAIVWNGRVRGGGNAQFTSYEGAVYGRFETSDGVFLLRPIPGTRQYRIVSTESWRQFFPSSRDVMIPRFDGRREAVASSAAKPETTTEENPEADLLVLYNAEFKDDHGGTAGAVARINYLVELANQCYANSNVNFSVRLVRTAEVEYDNDLHASTALSDLTDHINGLEDADNLRDKYGADFVVLMRSLRQEHEFAGLAWFLSESFRGAVSLFEDYAYAVVGDGEFLANGRYYYAEETTLAHEIGHLMGNEHDRANSGELEPLRRNAYGFHLGESYRTVMSYPQSDSEKNIPHFSNPHVEYDGIPTGDSENNCAHAMSEIAAKVAEWRPRRVADNGKDFLDVEAPYIIKAKIAGDNDGKITETRDVEITFSAADNRDIVAYKIVERSGNDGEETEWQTINPKKRIKIRKLAFRLADSDKRMRRIYIYVKDSAGNISERERLKIRLKKSDEN